MPEPPPLPTDPDALEHDEEDVLPTLWRRGRRQPAFVAGCFAYVAALLIGSTNLWTASPAAAVAAALLLIVAAGAWGFAHQTNGPIFSDTVATERAPAQSVVVEWRTEADGRRPAGTGRVETDDEALVLVRGTPYWWDAVAMAGIAGATSWLVFGPPWRNGPWSWAGFVLTLLALHRFGLPRRRRVESRVRWQDVERVDLRGALFVVTTTLAEPMRTLHFAARHSRRLRLLRMLRARLPHRFFVDERMREWHAAPPREPSLADIERRLERVRQLEERPPR